MYTPLRFDTFTGSKMKLTHCIFSCLIAVLTFGGLHQVDAATIAPIAIQPEALFDFLSDNQRPAALSFKHTEKYPKLNLILGESIQNR